MALNEKEKTTIKDLQTQEQTCIKKYKKYGQDAKDPVLKDLFSTLEKNEQKHYDTLGQILEGIILMCLILPIQPSEIFLLISRLRSRIMQKCCINTRQ